MTYRIGSALLALLILLPSVGGAEPQEPVRLVHKGRSGWWLPEEAYEEAEQCLLREVEIQKLLARRKALAELETKRGEILTRTASSARARADLWRMTADQQRSRALMCEERLMRCIDERPRCTLWSTIAGVGGAAAASAMCIGLAKGLERN